MSRTARKSVATKELLRHVAKRSTGRLSVASPVGALTVYLMAGDIVGAESHRDDAELLRRVGVSGALSQERIGALAQAGEGVFGPLLDEVPGAVIEPILFERFRDNLVGFVAQDALPRFEALSGVFVDNMQMGHNAARLIDSACKDADLAQRAEGGLRVRRGVHPPRDEVEQGVTDVLTGPDSVEAVLQRAPVEPWTGRALIAALLDAGVLAFDEGAGEPSPVPQAATSGRAGLGLAPVPTPALDELPTLYEDDDDDDEPTVAAPRPAPVELAEPQPVVPPPDPAPAAVEEDLEEIEPDEPLHGGDADAAPAPRPDDLAMWLDQGTSLDDEDMAFFEDHEDDRGGGSGGFLTDAHNLDKIDVGGGHAGPEKPAAAPPKEEVLEADEAPTAKFSAPMLSEGDAIEKVEVCNDVLRRVAAAFDEAEGAGAGRAAVQLLVDGSPSKFAALLHDLAVLEDGVLPVEEVLANLAGRPPTEHRQLINSALKNVIERALSSAADALPEDAFDDVYESVAGYNQRLGL